MLPLVLCICSLDEDEDGDVESSDTTRQVTIVNNSVNFTFAVRCTQEDN